MQSAWIVGAWCLLWSCPPLAIAADDLPPSTKRAGLEDRVVQLLQQDDIQRRGQVEELFALADTFVHAGNEPEAVRLYTEALRVDPWRFDYQLKLALLLQRRGNTQLAAEKALEVYRRAADARLVREAEALLMGIGVDVSALPEPEPFLGEEQRAATEFLFVPIGPVDTELLNGAIPELQRHLGITYSITDKVLDPVELERAFDEWYAAHVYQEVIPRLSPMHVLVLVAVARLLRADLKTTEGQARLVNTAFLNRPKRPKRRGQFDVVPFIFGLRRRYPLSDPPPIRGYLGVTQEDLFVKDANYLFASNHEGYAVMSYARFQETFYGNPPNRSTLRERFYKQAVTSSLFMLGIPRCTSPVCVRAYPHSLSEFDRKGTQLCEWCRRQLHVALKQPLTITNI